MENLRRIKEFDESYYDDNVKFEVVYSKDLSVKKAHDFFVKNELVKKNGINLSFVSEFNTDYYVRFPYNNKNLSREFKALTEIIREKLLKKEELSPFEKDFFADFSRLLADLAKTRFSSLGAACLFNARLFLDAEGRFHICEKMNEKFPLGDVWKGFDYKKMVKIVKSYIEVISKKCNHCEIRYLCPRCYPFFAEDGRFEMDKDFCKDIKVTIIQKLEDLIRLKEKGLMV